MGATRNETTTTETLREALAAKKQQQIRLRQKQIQLQEQLIQSQKQQIQLQQQQIQLQQKQIELQQQQIQLQLQKAKKFVQKPLQQSDVRKRLTTTPVLSATLPKRIKPQVEDKARLVETPAIPSPTVSSYLSLGAVNKKLISHPVLTTPERTTAPLTSVVSARVSQQLPTPIPIILSVPPITARATSPLRLFVSPPHSSAMTPAAAIIVKGSTNTELVHQQNEPGTLKIISVTSLNENSVDQSLQQMLQLHSTPSRDPSPFAEFFISDEESYE